MTQIEVKTKSLTTINRLSKNNFDGEFALLLTSQQLKAAQSKVGMDLNSSVSNITLNKNK